MGRQLLPVLVAAYCVLAFPLPVSIGAQETALSPQHPLLDIRNLDTLEGFEAATGHNYTISEEMLIEGTNLAGHGKRFQRFLLKWLSGDQVKLGVIGGSVSYGSGASAIENSWFPMLANFLQTAHEQANVSSRNGAVSAAESSYMVMCLDNHVDPDVDLVIIDYALNDPVGDQPLWNSSALRYERLLRKVMSLESAPAVLNAMFIRCCAWWRDSIYEVPFYNTVEDFYTTVAKYYGLPVVSVRNALWHPMRNSVPGFSRADIFKDQLVHPNDYGQRVYLDFFVYAVQRALLELSMALRVPSRASRVVAAVGLVTQKEGVPPGSDAVSTSTDAITLSGGSKTPRLRNAETPSTGQNTSSNAATPDKNATSSAACADASTRLPLLMSRIRELSAALANVPPLPVPMRKGNEVIKTLSCVGAQLLPSIASDAQGFEFGHESKGLYGLAKFGWIATEPGSKVTLQVSTAVPPDTELEFKDVMLVYLGYLKSYEHMGIARVTCVSGCECKPLDLDAHHQYHNSQSFTKRLLVTPHPQCHIQVLVLNESTSGEHKFKITSVIVTEFKPHSPE